MSYCAGEEGDFQKVRELALKGFKTASGMSYCAGKQSQKIFRNLQTSCFKTASGMSYCAGHYTRYDGYEVYKFSFKTASGMSYCAGAQGKKWVHYLDAFAFQNRKRYELLRRYND